MRLAKLTVLFVLLFVCSAVWAAVPKLINFQGILKDGLGNPVTDGSYSGAFKIYDAASGGNVLWAETLSVTTTDGLFTVLLGSSNPVPDSAFDDTTRWLGITVASDPEMTPRQKLVSVPYAFRSLGGGAVPSGIQEFASSGTHQFIVPQDVTSLLIEAWGAGGGGGGGGSSGGGGGGGGGGAGAYSRAIVPVTPGQSYNVKIGVGGTGGTAGGGAGGTGGNSGFETLSATILLVSAGGNGGQGGATGPSGAGGAAGTGGLSVDPNAPLKRDGKNGTNGGNGAPCNFGICSGGGGGLGASTISGTIAPLGSGGGNGGGGGSQSPGGNTPPTPGMTGGNGYVLIQW